MRVVLTGATGTIGLAVLRALSARGDHVIALSRDLDRARERLGDGVELHRWTDPTEEQPPAAALSGVDAVVNLLGEPVARRWSAEAKRRIRDSRVLSTRRLVEGLRALPDGTHPAVLICGSATGYYGARGEEVLDEQAPAAEDFLARVVVEWEREALNASDIVRVALSRTGVVLSPRGGALGQMLPFFRLAIGGPVAGGRQYMPWVHLEDVVGAVLHLLDHDTAAGAFNVTAPEPVSNRDFSRALGRALNRPAVLPVPGFALRLMYGEMAEIVTTGARVVPRRLRASGYEFRFAELDRALEDVLR